MFLLRLPVEIFSGLQAGSDETDDEPEVLCTPNHDDIRGICLSPLGNLLECAWLSGQRIRAEAHWQTDKRTEKSMQEDRQTQIGRKDMETGGKKAGQG